MNEDGNLILGDFAVASVMGDTRTCTRSTLGKKYQQLLVISLHIDTEYELSVIQQQTC